MRLGKCYDVCVVRRGAGVLEWEFRMQNWEFHILNSKFQMPPRKRLKYYQNARSDTLVYF